MIGQDTRVVDLHGRRMVPGFNDAHVHFYSGGFNLTSVQLRDAKSQAEFRDRIREFTARQPLGTLDHGRRMGPRKLIAGAAPS